MGRHLGLRETRAAPYLQVRQGCRAVREDPEESFSVGGHVIPVTCTACLVSSVIGMSSEGQIWPVDRSLLALLFPLSRSFKMRATV